MKKVDLKSISNEKLIKILFFGGFIPSKEYGRDLGRDELVKIYNLNRKKKK